ncbi:MAG: ATP-binding protein, partial [Chloroflexota bacterium]
AAVLEERQRIAAEMHDGLAQTLSYLGLKTDRAGELLRQGRTAKVAAEFSHMEEAIDQATVDVRRSIASLRENPRPQRTLQEEICLVSGRNKGGDWPVIELHDDLPGSLYLPSSEMEQVSKVVQEALLNVYQHANAERVIVRMTAQDKKVAIVIDDNGRGFDPSRQEETAGDHFGLSIMKARAVRIGGRLAINSRVGEGTEIELAWRPANGQGSFGNGEDRSFAEGEPPAALTAQM